MGVPKFYRWLSERYPKINQIVSDTSLIPEFDNLYLDMNGILHGCTHPNDDSLSKQLSERDVFLGVFHYIDRIVTHIVRPRRVLYMAIDGVAPRAKMNQQRSRRFRSAKDAAAARAEAAARGETVDDGEVFDSNCITPGTEFMAKVSAHLKYFIRKKIKEDPLWQRLTVIFSGHEVPGEGEHKIMQYIRDQRCAGAFAPNTRHCMYGQDADLILLGLVAHEPHFTLLREVVNFNNGRAGGARGAKNAVKLVMKTTADAQFQLLHLSVLREYLWVEFTLEMSAATASALSLERVVDDFVFITFLVGNDFLPHMPSLDIGEEAFALLFGIYRELAPTWRGGYLTRDGSIEDPDRLEQFLAAVGAKEDEIFATREIEEEGMRERQRRHGNRQNIPSEEDLDDEETRLQEAYEDAMLQVLGHVPEGSTPGQKDFKGRYYFEKFGITPVHTQVHSELRHQYVAGLQWCLAYYYRGCVSWEWFFPFHYVPMLSDLTGLRDMFGKVSFRLSKPFLPFEQLLGCLPAASAWCLPKPYALLMTSPDSPIADFYPADFKIDMNGKRNPWEAVNLLPFIDASRLFAAVHERCPVQLLSPEERKRNTYGAVLEYTYSEHATGTVVSCNPEIGLSDIRQCVSEEKELPWSIESHTSFTSALPLGSTIPLAGFPSLNVLPIEQAEAKPIKLNVFGSESRYSTMVLTLRRPRGLPSAEQLAPRVIGRSVFVNWPLLHEAKITGVSDATQEFKMGANGRLVNKRFTPDQAARWQLLSDSEQNAYLKGRATPGSGGVDVGPIGSRLTVRPLQGMRRDAKTGALTKMFGSEEADVPLHMALWQSPAPDPRFEERGAPSLEVRLPVGSRVLCLTAAGAERQARGCVGRVKALTNGKVDVIVDLRPPEPPFGAAVAAAVQDRYYPAHAVCQRLRIRPDVFGKVVGIVNADPGRYDIGLNLKANGRYQLLGYSRCVLREQAAWSTADTVRIVGSAGEDAAEEVGAWEFTEAAARLVALYMTRYPQMFAALHTLEHGRSYEAGALFGPHAGEETLAEVKAWLESLPTAGLPRTPLTTKAMSKDAVRAVERAADVRQAVIVGEGRIVKREFKGVNASDLLRANTIEATDAPLAQEGHPELGDRVVNLCARGVPFALWGTVVACHYHSACVEVVFDEEFIGGGTLQGMCSNYRGLLVPWTAVARLHTPEQTAASAKRGAAAAAAAPAPQQQAAKAVAAAAPPPARRAQDAQQPQQQRQQQQQRHAAAAAPQHQHAKHHAQPIAVHPHVRIAPAAAAAAPNGAAAGTSGGGARASKAAAAASLLASIGGGGGGSGLAGAAALAPAAQPAGNNSATASLQLKSVLGIAIGGGGGSAQAAPAAAAAPRVPPPPTDQSAALRSMLGIANGLGTPQPPPPQQQQQRVAALPEPAPAAPAAAAPAAAVTSPLGQLAGSFAALQLGSAKPEAAAAAAAVPAAVLATAPAAEKPGVWVSKKAAAAAALKSPVLAGRAGGKGPARYNYLQAQGPDGTRGFTIGRGKALQSAAVTKPQPAAAAAAAAAAPGGLQQQAPLLSPPQAPAAAAPPAPSASLLLSPDSLQQRAAAPPSAAVTPPPQQQPVPPAQQQQQQPAAAAPLDTTALLKGMLRVGGGGGVPPPPPPASPVPPPAPAPLQPSALNGAQPRAAQPPPPPPPPAPMASMPSPPMMERMASPPMGIFSPPPGAYPMHPAMRGQMSPPMQGYPGGPPPMGFPLGMPPPPGVHMLPPPPFGGFPGGGPIGAGLASPQQMQMFAQAHMLPLAPPPQQQQPSSRDTAARLAAKRVAREAAHQSAAGGGGSGAALMIPSSALLRGRAAGGGGGAAPQAKQG